MPPEQLLKGTLTVMRLPTPEQMAAHTKTALQCSPLRDAGAVVEHVFVNFYYDIFPESKKVMKELNVTLHSLATWWDVLAVVKACGKEHATIIGHDWGAIASFGAVAHSPTTFSRLVAMAVPPMPTPKFRAAVRLSSAIFTRNAT